MPTGTSRSGPPGLLRGDGHHIEAQVGEKDQRGGLNQAEATP